MAAGQFSQVFSAATAAFTQQTKLYHSIYSEHMGVEQNPPAITNDDYPWPDVNFDNLSPNSPFSTGVIRIATYARAPYYSYANGEDQPPVGFEIDFCDKILEEINKYYNTDLKVEWYEAEIDENLLFWDGTEPTVIGDELKLDLGDKYDMIMSGMLTKFVDPNAEDEGGQMPPNMGGDQCECPCECECCTKEKEEAAAAAAAIPATVLGAPYSWFTVGACFCGEHHLMALPTPAIIDESFGSAGDVALSDIDATCKILADYSKQQGITLLVTHTNSLSDPLKANNSIQSQSGREVVKRINDHGGSAESQPRLVWGILDGIRASTVQVYVGDGLQIQVMNKNTDESNFAHVKNIQLIFSEMVIAPIMLDEW